MAKTQKEVTERLLASTHGRRSGDPHKNVARNRVYELHDMRSARKKLDKGVYYGK